jgi:hypothetical protein
MRRSLNAGLPSLCRQLKTMRVHAEQLQPIDDDKDAKRTNVFVSSVNEKMINTPMTYAHVCNPQGAQMSTIRNKRIRWLIFRKLYILIICTKLLYYCANDILFVQIKLFVQDLCSVEQELCRIIEICALLKSPV